MKTKTLFIFLLTIITAISGCKKEDGLNGKKSIVGNVYYDDGAAAVQDIAPGAIVYISYDTNVSTGVVDETTTSDAKGAYSFKKLKKGSYFVWAEYTTNHGFKYVTPGHSVTLDPDDDSVSLNIRLY